MCLTIASLIPDHQRGHPSCADSTTVIFQTAADEFTVTTRLQVFAGTGDLLAFVAPDDADAGIVTEVAKAPCVAAECDQLFAQSGDTLRNKGNDVVYRSCGVSRPDPKDTPTCLVREDGGVLVTLPPKAASEGEQAARDAIATVLCDFEKLHEGTNVAKEARALRDRFASSSDMLRASENALTDVGLFAEKVVQVSRAGGRVYLSLSTGDDVFVIQHERVRSSCIPMIGLVHERDPLEPVPTNLLLPYSVAASPAKLLDGAGDLVPDSYWVVFVPMAGAQRRDCLSWAHDAGTGNYFERLPRRAVQEPILGDFSSAAAARDFINSAAAIEGVALKRTVSFPQGHTRVPLLTPVEHSMLPGELLHASFVNSGAKMPTLRSCPSLFDERALEGFLPQCALRNLRSAISRNVQDSTEKLHEKLAQLQIRPDADLEGLRIGNLAGARVGCSPVMRAELCALGAVDSEPACIADLGSNSYDKPAALVRAVKDARLFFEAQRFRQKQSARLAATNGEPSAMNAWGKEYAAGFLVDTTKSEASKSASGPKRAEPATATVELAEDQGAAHKSRRRTAKQPLDQPRVDTLPGTVVLESDSDDESNASDNETYPKYPSMSRASETFVIGPVGQSSAANVSMAVAIEDSSAPGRAGLLAPDDEPLYRSHNVKANDYDAKYHSLCAPP